MNKYIEWLNLDFDPFAEDAASHEFYCSDHRQQLLDQIVEFSLYSNAMIAVTGPLGAGKTTLAENFCERFAEEAVCVKVAATLFMTQEQFLEALHAGLPFNAKAESDADAAIARISQYAAELDLEARSLILIIDDAHELSAEVLQLLVKLLESSVDASIHALLFGENPLDNLLQSTLSAEAQERLAVFPLEGFASEETHEYIRFKMLDAGYSKELPIGGGTIGAIHNSAQGMPGSINSLTVEALNAAAPGSEPIHIVEDEDFGPLLGSEPMEQLDELEDQASVESEAAEDESPQQVGILGIQPRYWASAAALVVLLTGTLLFWDTSEQESAPASIPIAVIPIEMPQPEADAAIALLPVEEPIAVEVTEEQSELAVAAVEEPVPAERVLPSPVVAAPAAEVVQTPTEEIANEIEAPQSLVEETVAEIEAPEPPAEVVVDVEEPEAQAEVLEIAEEIVEEIAEEIVEASSFEERLLRAPADNYAVQLLASHSETNIRAFIEQLGSDRAAGYFETRHQGRPWFVALLAEFENRAQATEAISALPAELRSNQPWVRSVAGIQTDIRELMNSRLASSQ